MLQHLSNQYGRLTCQVRQHVEGVVCKVSGVAANRQAATNGEGVLVGRVGRIIIIVISLFLWPSFDHLLELDGCCCSQRLVRVCAVVVAVAMVSGLQTTLCYAAATHYVASDSPARSSTVKSKQFSCIVNGSSFNRLYRSACQSSRQQLGRQTDCNSASSGPDSSCLAQQRSPAVAPSAQRGLFWRRRRLWRHFSTVFLLTLIVAAALAASIEPKTSRQLLQHPRLPLKLVKVEADYDQISSQKQPAVKYVHQDKVHRSANRSRRSAAAAQDTYRKINIDLDYQTREDLIELLANFWAHKELALRDYRRQLRLHRQQHLNSSADEVDTKGESEEQLQRKLKMRVGADNESLLNWLRAQQGRLDSLKNASIELLEEAPNRTINVCLDGPKILVFPNISDILYCYTHDQWIAKLWSDLRLSPFHYPIILLNILIFLIGTTGNIFVCLSVYRNHQLRSVTNYFIVNLAFADFLVILICLPATVVWDLSLTWFFGTLSCKLIMFLQDVSISVSVLTLTSISIDRYYAICYPLKFKSSLSQAKKIIVLIWLVSLLTMAPDLVYLRAQVSEEISEAGLDTVLYSDCNYNWSERSSRLFQFVKTILLYLLPFILMLCAHHKIMRTLREASHELPSPPTASAAAAAAAQVSQADQQKQQIQSSFSNTSSTIVEHPLASNAQRLKATSVGRGTSGAAGRVNVTSIRGCGGGGGGSARELSNHQQVSQHHLLEHNAQVAVEKQQQQPLDMVASSAPGGRETPLEATPPPFSSKTLRFDSSPAATITGGRCNSGATGSGADQAWRYRNLFMRGAQLARQNQHHRGSIGATGATPVPANLPTRANMASFHLDNGGALALLQRSASQQQQSNVPLTLTMHNKSKLESRRSAAKMLMTIVILFGICYLPVHLINFLRQFIDDIPQTDITSTISMLAHCFCYLNSAINPIIYNHMNSVFRAEFRKFLSCLDCRPAAKRRLSRSQRLASATSFQIRLAERRTSRNYLDSSNETCRSQAANGDSTTFTDLC